MLQLADTEAAIKRAIEKYDIAMEHRDRLAARPVQPLADAARLHPPWRRQPGRRP